MNSKYTVVGFDKNTVDKCDGDLRWITGYTAERGVDTLKEAKAEMKHILSEDYRRSAEMSERLAYAQVLDVKGECVLDMFGK